MFIFVVRMGKNKLILVVTLLLAVVVVGCNKDNRRMVKMAKSRTIAEKDTAAVWFYEQEKYERALPLLEELVPLYSGLDRQQIVYYYYCYSHYLMGQLVSAQFYFADFARKFPTNKHAEEAEYMSSKCYFLLSDPYQLDQSFTNKAIDAIQLFASRFPESDYKEEANQMLIDLRERLAEKSFRQALLYYNITYYKAAVEAFKLMINEFPDSKYREEAQFMLFKSAQSLASASINSKKLIRYRESLKFQEKFVKKYPESEFSIELDELTESTGKTILELEENSERAKEEGLFLKTKSDLQTVLRTKDMTERSERMESALANFNKLSEGYPSSRRIPEINKLFEKVNKLQIEN